MTKLVHNVCDPRRRDAIFRGLLHVLPDSFVIACVGKPLCDMQGDFAVAAQESGCALCERWLFCGQSRQFVKMRNPTS